MTTIDKKKLRKTANDLSGLLADTYTLYLKTHNYHWNVTGPMFNTLHTLFEDQYTELATAVDDIAERIRTLGYRAPGSFEEFGELAGIKEATRKSLSAEKMIEQLAADSEAVARSAMRVLKSAEDVGDEATADLAIRRIDTHEKNGWMLRSHLQ